MGRSPPRDPAIARDPVSGLPVQTGTAEVRFVLAGPGWYITGITGAVERCPLPSLRPVELWAGLFLFQAAFEPQDGHSYLSHLYREPLLPFAGSSDTTPPSSLWTEGVGDSLVPNNASRAMAVELGIPHVRPVVVAVPDLVELDAPVAGNVAAGITAGYFQYLPSATPWCAQVGQLEGHYCPQSAPEAKAQRLHFLQTALQGTAEIVEPF